jgi:hypothetical protein
MDLFS